MSKLTVVGRDNSNARHDYEAVLIYDVDVVDTEYETVHAAFVECREADIEDVDPEEIEILFAFEGDLSPTVDWRG